MMLHALVNARRVSSAPTRSSTHSRGRLASPQRASYAILDQGMGVAVWCRDDAGPGENEVAWQLAEFALRLVGAGPAALRPR